MRSEQMSTPGSGLSGVARLQSQSVLGTFKGPLGGSGINVRLRDEIGGWEVQVMSASTGVGKGNHWMLQW